MKTMRIDDNAHELILCVKTRMKAEGLEHPSISEAIRWLAKKAGVEN
jgi:hypothetical protein